MTSETFDERFGRLACGLRGVKARTLDTFPFFGELQRLWPSAERAKVGCQIVDEVEKLVRKLGLDRVTVFGGIFMSNISCVPLRLLDSLLQSAQWIVTDAWTGQSSAGAYHLRHSCGSKQLFHFMENRPHHVLSVALDNLDTDYGIASHVEGPSATSSSLPTVDDSASPATSALSAATVVAAASSPARKEYVSFEVFEIEGKADEFCIKPLNATFLKAARKFFGLREDLQVGDIVVLHDCPWHAKSQQFTLCRALALPSHDTNFCYQFRKLDSDVASRFEPKLTCRAPCPSSAGSTSAQSNKSSPGATATSTNENRLSKLFEILANYDSAEEGAALANEMKVALENAALPNAADFDPKQLMTKGVGLLAVGVATLMIAVIRRRQQRHASSDAPSAEPSFSSSSTSKV